MNNLTPCACCLYNALTALLARIGVGEGLNKYYLLSRATHVRFKVLVDYRPTMYDFGFGSAEIDKLSTHYASSLQHVNST